MPGPEEEAVASAVVPGVDVVLRASVTDTGRVRCVLSCNGQRVVAVFSDVDVDVDVQHR